MKTRQNFALLALGLLCLWSGFACGERSLSTCDITQRACQEDIYYRVLNLRGDGYDPFGGLPPVTVITEDQFRQQLVDEQAKTDQSGPNPWDKALLLFHFTSSTGTSSDGGVGTDAGTDNSTIDDQVTHVYAFYDPTPKTVTIISHPSQTGPDAEKEGMITLAHELVHAMQDRESDLQKQDFATSDAYFAWDAMIEGDARFYEYLFENQLLNLGYSQSTIVQMPDAELNYIYKHYDQAGAPMFAAKLLVYPLGAKYLATAYHQGGNAAVRHAYAEAPQHTVGLLVGADGRVPSAGSGDACPAPYVATLPTSGKTAGADEFGALLFYTFLRGWNVDQDTAFSTAQTWTGDFLRIQTAADFSMTAGVWRVELSAQPPASVAQALGATGELNVTTGTHSLQIQVTDSPTPLAWTAADSCP
jgi:hypothetical protein